MVLNIGNAPWHRGRLIDEVSAANPHLELKRPPSSNPQPNAIERFWKILRCRAKQNRLFDFLPPCRGRPATSCGTSRPFDRWSRH